MIKTITFILVITFLCHDIAIGGSNLAPSSLFEGRGDMGLFMEAKDLGLVLMVNRLVEKLNDPETSVATEAARALRKLGFLNPELITKEVVDIIYEKASDPDPHMYIEEACIHVLAERTKAKDSLAQDIVDMLYKDLDDPYRSKRLAAVKVLGEVASVNIDSISGEIVERLYEKSEDNEYAVLALCQIAMGNHSLISDKIVERLCEGVEKLGIGRKGYIIKVLEKLAAERSDLISMERVYGLYDRFNIGGQAEHPLTKKVLREISKGDYSLITQETVDSLYKTLKERDTFRCKSAVNTLVEIARVKEEFAQDIVDRLYRKLNDRNYNILFDIPESAPKVRQVCAMGLGEIAVFRPSLITERIVGRLYKRINDRYPYVRTASSMALAGVASVRPELITKKIVHRLYKKSAIAALIKIVRIRNEFAKDIIDWAYEGLESRIKDRKITAIRVIGEMASVRPDLITKDMVNSLYEKLNSKYIFIVAKALGKIADARPDLMTQDIVERLLEEVNDRSSQHGFDYHIIAEVLGKIAMVRPELFTIDMEYNLYKKLDDPDYHVRANAAQILGEIAKGRPVISPKGFIQLLQDTEKGFGLEEHDLKYGLMMLDGLSSSSDIYCLNEIRKRIEENRDYRKTSLLVKLAYSYLRESRFDEFRRIIIENKESKIEDLLVILRERLIEIIGIKEDISGRIGDGMEGITRLLRKVTQHPALAIYIIDKIIVTLQYLRQGIGTDIGLSMGDFDEASQQYSQFRDTLVLILSNPEIDILTKRNLVRSIPFGETGEIDAFRYQVLHFVQGMTQSDSNQGVLGFLRSSLHNLDETFNNGITALKAYREWVASDGTRGADILEGLGYTLTDSDRVPPSKKNEVLLTCDTLLSTLNTVSGERGLAKIREMLVSGIDGGAFLTEDRELIGRLTARPETRDTQGVLETITSARERLREMINNSTGEELIYLFKMDHRLELLFYPAYSSADLSDTREFIGLLIALLNDSILNGYMPESLGNVRKELEQLKGCFKEDRDSYLRLYSIVKRIERLLGEKVEEFISRYNSHAVKTAEAINVTERQRPWVEDFCSNLFRGDTVFLLSQLLINSKKAIMEKAGITGWQVVVSGRMEGRLHYIEDVSRLGEVSEDEILVIPALPMDGLPITNVRGIITFSEDSILSHPAIRLRQHGVPFAVCPGKEILEPWFGKEVSIDVSGHGVKIKKGITPSKKAHPQKKARVSIPTAVTTGDIIILPPQYTPNTAGNKAFRLNEIDEGDIRTRHITLGFSLYEYILNLPENKGKKKREIESLVIPEGLLRKIQLSIIENIGHGLVFLRSSTNAEDLAGYSGAGLYDSFGAVGPNDLDKLERYIKKVLASVWNERALKDREANGIEHSDVHMAVLVHEMLQSDYSFVVHTINPVNGLQDEVVIEVVQGLGETLVSGNYPGLAHRFIYNRKDGGIKVISYANKDKKLVLENGRIVERVVDYTEDIFVQEPSRWEGIISRIAKASIGLEEKFRTGQDIEGCIVMEDGEYKFSFIQSRDQQKERVEDKTLSRDQHEERVEDKTPPRDLHEERVEDKTPFEILDELIRGIEPSEIHEFGDKTWRDIGIYRDDSGAEILITVFTGGPNTPMEGTYNVWLNDVTFLDISQEKPLGQHTQQTFDEIISSIRDALANPDTHKARLAAIKRERRTPIKAYTQWPEGKREQRIRELQELEEANSRLKGIEKTKFSLKTFFEILTVLYQTVGGERDKVIRNFSDITGSRYDPDILLWRGMLIYSGGIYKGVSEDQENVLINVNSYQTLTSNSIEYLWNTTLKLPDDPESKDGIRIETEPRYLWGHELTKVEETVDRYFEFFKSLVNLGIPVQLSRDFKPMFLGEYNTKHFMNMYIYPLFPPKDSTYDTKVMVASLLSVIRTQVKACRLDNKELVLAIDTDIGNLKDCAGELLKELTQLQDRLKGEGMDNIRILIGEGTSLKAQMDSYLRDAEREGRGFIISAVLKSENLEHKLYENIKDKIRITAVSDPDISIYIPIISILELSIKRAMGDRIDGIIEDYKSMPNVGDIIERDGILTIIILPKPEPIPVEQLRERYKHEAKVLSSA